MPTLFRRFLRRLAAALVVLLLTPQVLLAQTPSSTNYKLESSTFDFGGGYSTSTTYGSRGSAGEVETGETTSSNFNIFSGFFPRAYPGIPGIPTLTNTGGNLYNALDFVVNTGGNPSDVNYAIAISSDNFVTTNYVQANDSIGATTTWQTYLNWGGSLGQRLVGLSVNTSYTIKVKARYGASSETGYSGTASAATVNPIFSATIQGVNSGATINSFTTNATTTATTVTFSTLQTGSIRVAAQKLTVTTNAAAGYSATLMQNHDLSSNNGATIPAVSATNSSPAAWPGGVTSAAFGYHTTDATLCIGNTSRFATDNTFAAATSTPYEVSCNTGPVTNETTNIVFKVEVESLQASGDYKNQITYVIAPQY